MKVLGNELPSPPRWWYALVMSWQAVKITDRKRATLQRALVLLLLDVLLLDVGLCPRKDHICPEGVSEVFTRTTHTRRKRKRRRSIYSMNSYLL